LGISVLYPGGKKAKNRVFGGETPENPVFCLFSRKMYLGGRQSLRRRCGVLLRPVEFDLAIHCIYYHCIPIFKLTG
jgi:hypothetical protein